MSAGALECIETPPEYSRNYGQVPIISLSRQIAYAATKSPKSCDLTACQVDSRKTLLVRDVQNTSAELPKERKPLLQTICATHQYAEQQH